MYVETQKTKSTATSLFHWRHC